MVEFLGLLATATLFGGMMLYSFGFAPFVFHALPVDAAGQMLRKAFPWYYLFVLATAFASAALVFALDQLSALILAIVALIALYARQSLMIAINTARDKQIAGDSAAKRRFGQLHGLSVALNFVQLLGIGYVLYRFL